MNRKFDTLSVVAMCLAVAVLTLAVVTVGFLSYFGGREGLAFVSKMNTVREIVDEKFVEDVDWDSAADSASAGIVASLGDRWSYYMTDEEMAAYRDRSNNSTTGIGVTVTLDPEGRGVRVESVVTSSPAERAGITPGCVITAVEGKSLAGLGINEVGPIIKAQIGEYEIEFLSSSGELCSAMIKNEYVYTSPISYEMLENNIGYIRISDFEKGAATDGIAAIETLREKGAASLIFDVRSNPGGQLSELIELLDYILPEGEIFVSVDAEGAEEIYYSESDSIDMPMAVLINVNSYSAAEFFAAALSEYDAAILVGEASTGKGRSQQTFTLSDGSAVHISTKRYLTPGRVDLSKVGGLVPDIEVALGDTEDSQLRAAVEYLS